MTIAITKLATNTFTNDMNILVPSKPPIFLLKKKKSIKKLKLPAMEVASASPLIFNGNINIILNAMFNIRETLAIFTVRLRHSSYSALQ